MSQNMAVHKTDTHDVATRRTFFGALYQGCPQELYFELRAIHPKTHKAKALWGQLSNKQELGAILKHAEVLNKEGYGIYFAPCLRQSRQGKAEAAALVPALWVDIDCEGNPDQRDAGLIRLKDFDLAPSFIIDSGGGWHGYWLLDQPFALQTEAERQKIVAILRGLFKVLGGDDAYVKTVASIMRLPESVNTKPERGGAVVRIVDSHPERRYALEAFAWLESQPQQEKANRGGSVIQDGHQSLPPRTEAYLASGTTEGHRNHELFAAACQLRDAGHSQADVERDLIPRYVADGCSEKEGLKTIQSVYSRPAREPIAKHPEGTTQSAQHRISEMISRYGQPQAESARPPVEEVREIVKACAELDPLGWAVERQRLKSLCGQGIKTADLDRMYRQSQREMPSRYSHQERSEDMEHYFESNGRMIYRYHATRGPIDKVIADWTACIRERVTCIGDEGDQTNDIVVELHAGSHVRVITVPGEIFGDDLALRRFITGQAGEQFVCRAGMGRHLAVSIRLGWRWVSWAGQSLRIAGPTSRPILL